MQKILLILTILLYTGCSLAIYEEPVHISIQPPQTLEEFFDKLDSSITVHTLDIIDEQDATLTFQLFPPTNDANEAIDQYKFAYQDNINLLKNLLPPPDVFDSPSANAASEKEFQHLEELANKLLTLDTVIIYGASLTGPKKAIKNLKN